MLLEKMRYWNNYRYLYHCISFWIKFAFQAVLYAVDR